MSFGDHVILWLHVTAAIFTIGPGTAAIMSTPRYIRKRNPVVVGYLFRTTRIYSVAALLTLIFGLILAGMTHKFSQWWISASLTLFVVAFVLLVIILRDQRKALTALDAAEGAAVADAVEESVHGAAAGQATATATDHRAAVERGRIASLGGLTALIWLVILIFMVWH
jgi:type VI protein secretion system component VasK